MALLASIRTGGPAEHRLRAGPAAAAQNGPPKATRRCERARTSGHNGATMTARVFRADPGQELHDGRTPASAIAATRWAYRSGPVPPRSRTPSPRPSERPTRRGGRPNPHIWSHLAFRGATALEGRRWRRPVHQIDSSALPNLPGQDAFLSAGRRPAGSVSWSRTILTHEILRTSSKGRGERLAGQHPLEACRLHPHAAGRLCATWVCPGGRYAAGRSASSRHQADTPSVAGPPMPRAHAEVSQPDSGPPHSRRPDTLVKRGAWALQAKLDPSRQRAAERRAAVGDALPSTGGVARAPPCAGAVLAWYDSDGARGPWPRVQPDRAVPLPAARASKAEAALARPRPGASSSGPRVIRHEPSARARRLELRRTSSAGA